MPARATNQCCGHSQHIRASHALPQRSHGFEVHCTGVDGRAQNGLGYGQPVRTFHLVTDLVGGLLAVTESYTSGAAPIDLGKPNEFAIRWLHEKAIAIMGWSSELDSLPLPEDDPKKRQPDTSSLSQNNDLARSLRCNLMKLGNGRSGTSKSRCRNWQKS